MSVLKDSRLPNNMENLTHQSMRSTLGTNYANNKTPCSPSNRRKGSTYKSYWNSIVNNDPVNSGSEDNVSEGNISDSTSDYEFMDENFEPQTVNEHSVKTEEDEDAIARAIESFFLKKVMK